MFDSISFENFRSIRKLHVDLRPINVLFGPNGSGKSTFLQGLDLFSSTIRLGLRDSVRRAGGVSALRTLGLPRETITTISIQHETLEYSRCFDVSSNDYATGDELLVLNSQDGKLIVFDSSLKQIWGHPLSPVKYLTSNERFTSRSLWDLALEADLWNEKIAIDLTDLIGFQFELGTALITNCRRFNIDQLGQSGSRSQDGLDLGEHGEGLWNVLRNLRDDHASRIIYQRILSFLNRAFPSFREFELKTTGQNVTCLVHEHKQDLPYPVNLAPDGLFHLAYCLCLLYVSGNRASLVVLDEPDLSLHPWALTVLADAIKEATSKWNRQVIIATHSPTLLSEFKEDEILLMQSGETGVTATRVSEIQEDRDLLDRYDLGSLYQMNIIGKQGDKPLFTEMDAVE
ncbi:AAA family ATPase [Planctopirus hydrillae]|uniref:ATPase AAA-type core domain-containing protein n=1 Tax=Planctopirus hydrillae TaxID=1841610 RepID=A0A1C3EKD4_9PLAN|nr:AAA family ATPase [Planctopirus hydrillae]ODA33684.1 hypothetical protein A6X21_18320 [Planctopirus hydrillae]